MPPAALVDHAQIETSTVIYDLEAIRRVNPQRFEMEQLTAIVRLDCLEQVIVGYKDVGRDEFWVRGNMPGSPVLPCVLICEAAAQLCSVYCHLLNLAPDGFVGFSGMEDVRFRGSVRPGDRLLIVGKGERVQRRRTVFETQAFVGMNMVFHGRIIGVPLTVPNEGRDR